MRSKVVRTLALALLLCGINIVMGQQNPQGVDEKLKDARAKEIADGAQQIASFINKIELDWPESLKGSAFKESREQLIALLRRAYKSMNSGNNPDSATLNDLQVQWRKMRDILDKMVSELKPEEFIEATRYVQKIHQTITALRDPNIGHQFRSASKGMGKGAPGMGKGPAPAKSKLEEMLAEALKNNPDIRVAAAKLAEAEAELNRTRVQVTQKIVALNAAIARQKAEVAYRQKEYERYKGLLADRAIDVKLVEEVQDKLTLAKAQLEELEAQMPALLGKSHQAEKEAGDELRMSAALALLRFAGKVEAPKTAGPMAEKIRKALNRPISAELKDRPVREIVDALSKDSGLIITLAQFSGVPLPEKITIRCENIPFGAVLQLLEDSLPYYTIVVRNYGLLIAHSQNIPPGAVSVQEFLRQKPVEK